MVGSRRKFEANSPGARFPPAESLLQPPQLHWLPTSVSKKVGCRRVSPPASARFAMGNAPSSEGPTTRAAQKAGWPESDDASGAHRGVDGGYVVKCFARECTPAFALRPPATQADVQLPLASMIAATGEIVRRAVEGATEPPYLRQHIGMPAVAVESTRQVTKHCG